MRFAEVTRRGGPRQLPLSRLTRTHAFALTSFWLDGRITSNAHTDAPNKLDLDAIVLDCFAVLCPDDDLGTESMDDG